MLPRREALQRLTLLLGGVLSARLTAGLMGQVLYIGTSVEVSAEEQSLLAEAAEIIIPATTTPGARAAGAEQFIMRVLRDCYPYEEQSHFYAGLEALSRISHARFGQPLARLSEEQKAEAMRQIAHDDQRFFLLLKQLTVTGYFSSEIGATQALAYLPIPTRFEGDVPLAPGQKTWALS